MPERNRVTPMGDIVAIDLRGQWMGNRGCLHRGHDIVRHHQSRRWIICELEYKDWRAPMWLPNRWTPLFFLDEAVALAAGHRPCALCRRASYNAYRGAIGFTGSADDLDRQLHAERWDGHSKLLHELPWCDVPVGAYVMTDQGPARVDARRPSAGVAVVITPPTSCAALRGGYPLRL